MSRLFLLERSRRCRLKLWETAPSVHLSDPVGVTRHMKTHHDQCLLSVIVGRVSAESQAPLKVSGRYCLCWRRLPLQLCCGLRYRSVHVRYPREIIVGLGYPGVIIAAVEARVREVQTDSSRGIGELGVLFTTVAISEACEGSS